MKLAVPSEFSFALSLEFLRRSPHEVLHRLTERGVAKALRLGETAVVFEVQEHPDGLDIRFLSPVPEDGAAEQVANYVRNWFDLDTDLKPFYRMAAQDSLLSGLVTKYHGYRIVGQPDLFESLVWAVLGQQINLAFAYTLKQRFIQTFGQKLLLGEHEYFLFPTAATVALLTPEQLLRLQFSSQKSRYTIAIAEAFLDGTLSKEKLRGMPLAEARNELMKIKGIGNWTANYALMKTFRYPDAFPLEDAGLHNAIRNLKKMARKPTLPEVLRTFRKYKGWEAYATLYLWKTL